LREVRRAAQQEDRKQKEDTFHSQVPPPTGPNILFRRR
jgi:hypothetical protein